MILLPQKKIPAPLLFQSGHGKKELYMKQAGITLNQSNSGEISSRTGYRQYNLAIPHSNFVFHKACLANGHICFQKPAGTVESAGILP
jgi:hypothetical protein